MVADQGRGGLLGLVLEACLLVDLDAQPTGLEQLGHLLVVFEVGARRVPPRVAPTAVLLAEQAVEVGAVLVHEPPLGADPLVPVLGQRFGHLHANAVHHEVLLVLVGGEQFGGAVRHLLAHGHDVEGGVVGLTGLDGPEQVSDAQPRCFALARVGEAHALGGPGVVGPHHQIVAVAVHTEVAVHQLRDQQPFGLGPVELLAQHRGHALFEVGVAFHTAVGPLFGTELPLVAEQGGGVDERGDVVNGDALDHL